ncbi:MAG: (2Fe-2S)-binding protein [Gemmatimonadota bacterium]|nr:MAG: (2Fe-2S)-binding protein [Gemmatimonadota bacterium]
MGKDSDQTRSQSGISRRNFIGTLGAGALGAAVAGPGTATTQEAQSAADGHLVVALRVNGRQVRAAIEPRHTLLEVLRDQLELTGTKPGCARGECGACSVLMDGVPRYSCMTLAAEADGHEITTVEGVMQGEELGHVQQAFVEHDAFQCGYCTPGQVMAAEGLLRRSPNPSIEEIQEGMSGNLCRCGAYAHIFKAVSRAAELKRGGEV